MKWIDTRVQNPTCNHADTYFVVLFDLDITFVGFATWMPMDNYTKGQWQNPTNTNGNKRSCAEVLYWMPHPKIPTLD